MKLTSLNYQGIGSRLAAQVVDFIVLIVLYFVVGALMFGGPSFDVVGAAAMSFISIYGLIGFLYFVVLEGYKGATLGKMLVKIKVVQEDGSPIGFGAAIIRNILRIVDGLPFLYIIGMILISRSSKKQRLGDSVAKTVVVKAGGEQMAPPPYAPAPQYTPAYTPAYTPPPAPTPIQPSAFCINCGAEIRAGVGFCPKCGAKQAQ